jgi:hypothetical protein
MKIREIGIIIGSIPVICWCDEEISDKEFSKESQNKNNISKSAYISSILAFAEKFGSLVEYFESGTKFIAFNKNKIMNKQNMELDVYAYLILDKEKVIDKIVEKDVNPFLEEILSEFKSRYNHRSYSEVSQFESFNDVIEKKLKEQF